MALDIASLMIKLSAFQSHKNQSGMAWARPIWA